MSRRAPSATEPGAATSSSSARRAWLTLAVLLLFSMAAPLNQNKVPPLIPMLMPRFGLSVSGAGLLMTTFIITGLVLALPAGFIFQRLGYRITGLLAGRSIVLGSLLGATSQT